MNEYLCSVENAGVMLSGSTPQVSFRLTDVNQTFFATRFVAPTALANQMLAIVLAAISTNSQVTANLDTTTYQCSSIEILA
jgi:hypothetical protein